MDTDEALAVADKASDRNTPHGEAPSIMNMIYALEILADGYRQYVSFSKGQAASYRDLNAEFDSIQEKWDAWVESMNVALGTVRAQDADAILRAVRLLVAENKAVTAECDRAQGHWSDLMEFIRSALNLDVRATDDVAEVWRILGTAFADARLWAHVKELAAGNFRAGDKVTADAVNALSDAVKTGSEESWPPKGFTTRVTGGSVWMAPMGTDPAHHDSWTHIGWTKDVNFSMTFDKPKLNNLKHFPIGSPEPSTRVGRVTRPHHGPGESSIAFVRVGMLEHRGVWRREGDDAAPLLRWADVVRHQAAVEA